MAVMRMKYCGCFAGVPLRSASASIAPLPSRLRPRRRSLAQGTKLRGISLAGRS